MHEEPAIDDGALLTARDLMLTEPPLGPVSLALHPGEIALLAGPSGSGKTRLLRLMADLDRPPGGRVELGERPAEDMAAPEFRRAVGYLPATPDLGPASLRGLIEQVRRLSLRIS
ncbi:MAG TPA: ATP-binding cassette domain-containing protein, partial [Gammaproteobacteria bacterium]|nr:ATP-binding cassette domain-containing protein [Gammaproteobacteria bacterium]